MPPQPHNTGKPEPHYFSRRPSAELRTKELTVVLRGGEVRLLSAPGVFSGGRMDRGTELLIEAMDIHSGDRVLDLGCGYGPIALAAALLNGGSLVVSTDVNPQAVKLARLNADLNGLQALAALVADGLGVFRDGSLDVVCTNPPIRAGWRTVFALIDDAPRVLRPGGRLYLVARTRQGADTLLQRTREAFGNCETVRRGSGYKVMRAVVER